MPPRTEQHPSKRSRFSPMDGQFSVKVPNPGEMKDTVARYRDYRVVA